MSVKRLGSNGWDDLTVRRRYVSGEWQSMAAGKRFDGEEWQWLWSREHQYVTEYPLTAKQIYENNGEKCSELGYYVAEGSVDGYTYSNVLTLMQFDFSQIVSDTAGAEINSMEIYLQRDTTSQSNASSVVAHITFPGDEMSGFPARWYGISSLSQAVAQYPSFGRTEGKWTTLLSSTASGIQNGSINMLALGIANQTANFALFLPAEIKLRVTYTVTSG